MSFFSNAPVSKLYADSSCTRGESLSPAALVGCSFIILGRLAGKELGFKGSLAKYDATVAVMRSLLILADRANENFVAAKQAHEVASDFFLSIARIFKQANSLEIVPYSVVFSDFKEAQSEQETLEALVTELKKKEGLERIKKFFEVLHGRVINDMQQLIPELDGMLKLERGGNKGLFGLFSLPQLPVPDGINEHDATLLSAFIETWNFVSIFMDHDDKVSFLTEQIDMVFAYVQEHVISIMQRFFSNEQSSEGGIHITINIAL